MLISPVVTSRQFNNLGKPLTGGKIYYFEGGSFTVPFVTFADADGSVENAHPLVCDSSGIPPAAFVPPNTRFNVLLADANDVAIQSFENIEVTG